MSQAARRGRNRTTPARAREKRRWRCRVTQLEVEQRKHRTLCGDAGRLHQHSEDDRRRHASCCRHTRTESQRQTRLVRGRKHAQSQPVCSRSRGLAITPSWNCHVADNRTARHCKWGRPRRVRAQQRNSPPSRASARGEHDTPSSARAAQCNPANSKPRTVTVVSWRREN